MTTKVCFLGGTRYTRPLDGTAEKVSSDQFSWRSLCCWFFFGSSTSSVHRARSLLFAARLPLPMLRYVELLVAGQLLILWLIFRHRIQVVIAQSPYEGFVAAFAIKFAAWFGYKVGLAVEVHGDFEESLFCTAGFGFEPCTVF